MSSSTSADPQPDTVVEHLEALVFLRCRASMSIASPQLIPALRSPRRHASQACASRRSIRLFHGERRSFHGGWCPHTWEGTAQETGGAFQIFEDHLGGGKATP